MIPILCKLAPVETVSKPIDMEAINISFKAFIRLLQYNLFIFICIII